jgi:hypothetical protein
MNGGNASAFPSSPMEYMKHENTNINKNKLVTNTFFGETGVLKGVLNFHSVDGHLQKFERGRELIF